MRWLFAAALMATISGALSAAQPEVEPAKPQRVKGQVPTVERAQPMEVTVTGATWRDQPITAVHVTPQPQPVVVELAGTGLNRVTRAYLFRSVLGRDVAPAKGDRVTLQPGSSMKARLVFESDANAALAEYQVGLTNAPAPSPVSPAGAPQGRVGTTRTVKSQHAADPAAEEHLAYVVPNLRVIMGSALAVMPTWTAEGGQGGEGSQFGAGAQFGNSVSAAGDVNGDGFADVIVAARYHDNGETDEGKVYVFHGNGEGLGKLPNWSVESNLHFANLGGGAPGRGVAGAGDVNGDGYDDVAILVRANVPTYDLNRSCELQVYHGSATGLPATPSWTYQPGYDRWYAKDIAAAGDVNGDGFADLATVMDNRIGNNPDGDGYMHRATVMVFNGSQNGLPTAPSWQMQSSSNKLYGDGMAVSSAGDVNADGFDDLIVGEAGFGDSAGRAAVHLGSANGPQNSAAWTFRGPGPNSGYGFTVSSAGDVNGDGMMDVAVGSPTNGVNRVLVFHGSAAGLPSSPSWSHGFNNGTTHDFASSVRSAGDVDGDGYSDLVVGGLNAADGQPGEGMAFLFTGSETGLSLMPAWFSASDQDDAGFGVSVDSAGDVNNDGLTDIIIGANGFDSKHSDEGRAYLFLGRSAAATGGEPALRVTRNPQLVRHILTLRSGKTLAATQVSRAGSDYRVTMPSGREIRVRQADVTSTVAASAPRPSAPTPPAPVQIPPSPAPDSAAPPAVSGPKFIVTTRTGEQIQAVSAQRIGDSQGYRVVTIDGDEIRLETGDVFSVKPLGAAKPRRSR